MASISHGDGGVGGTGCDALVSASIGSIVGKVVVVVMGVVTIVFSSTCGNDIDGVDVDVVDVVVSVFISPTQHSFPIVSSLNIRIRFIFSCVRRQSESEDSPISDSKHVARLRDVRDIMSDSVERPASVMFVPRHDTSYMIHDT